MVVRMSVTLATSVCSGGTPTSTPRAAGTEIPLTVFSTQVPFSHLFQSKRNSYFCLFTTTNTIVTHSSSTLEKITYVGTT